MKKRVIVSLAAVVIPMSGVAHAAIFYVHNKSDKTMHVRPVWNGRRHLHDRLQPGQEIRYNSGIFSVTAIHWLEELAISGEGVMMLKPFEAQISLGMLNIGAKFHILSDGSYDYYFGVEGWGDGVAAQSNEL